MKKLLIATGNAGKKREFEQLLSGMDVEILTLKDIDTITEIEEDGHTFEENALKKASVSAQLTGLLCLADDSGLEVDALDGQPGVYSARFAGEPVSDEANNRKLLQLLAKVPSDQRRARFVCVIAICDPQGGRHTVRGECEGSINHAPCGDGGFGYDPLFVPLGEERTFAELPPEKKNLISHRGKALKLTKPVLEELLRSSS